VNTAAVDTTPPDLPGCAGAVDASVDASGLTCPLPILRAKKALAQLASGQVLKVITTDPHAVRDFQAFAKQTGNILLAQQASGEAMTHYLSRR